MGATTSATMETARARRVDGPCLICPSPRARNSPLPYLPSASRGTVTDSDAHCQDFVPDIGARSTSLDCVTESGLVREIPGSGEIGVTGRAVPTISHCPGFM